MCVCMCACECEFVCDYVNVCKCVCLCGCECTRICICICLVKAPFVYICALLRHRLESNVHRICLEAFDISLQFITYISYIFEVINVTDI